MYHRHLHAQTITAPLETPNTSTLHFFTVPLIIACDISSVATVVLPPAGLGCPGILALEDGSESKMT